MKKYTTLIILVAIIISSFAITTFAVEEERVLQRVSQVTIQTKAIRGCAPQTESVTFNTISDSVDHECIAIIGCLECPEELVGLSWGISDMHGFDPDAAYADMYFVMDCWREHKNGHGIAIYNINIYE